MTGRRLDLHQALRVIRDEHTSLAAMLKSLLQMVRLGPDPVGRGQHDRYFEVLRAMLFYIDEFPETRQGLDATTDAQRELGSELGADSN